MPSEEEKVPLLIWILAMLSLGSYGLAYYLRIEILKLPPYRFPYELSISGVILVNALTIVLARKEGFRLALFFGTFWFITGFALLCVTLSDIRT